MTDPIQRMYDEAFAPERAAPARPKVYVLVIDHRHGSDVSVYATHEAASASIEAYCREWWGAEMGGRYRGEGTETYPINPPEDGDKLVSDYFDAVDDECYSIEACEVQA